MRGGEGIKNKGMKESDKKKATAARQEKGEARREGADSSAKREERSFEILDWMGKMFDLFPTSQNQSAILSTFSQLK